MNTTEPGLEFDCRDGIATSLVGKAELKALPFAATIHSKVWPFIERHFGNSSEISYFLWGGAATEALLPILGYTTRHYSIHDIEICFTKSGRLFHSPHAIAQLNSIFVTANDLRTKIGGTSITSSRAGITFEEFQKTRILLEDGDLLLNNVALLYCPDEDAWGVSMPSALLTLANKTMNGINIKSWGGLITPDRVARRLCRNISKAIRFELATRLRTTDLFVLESGAMARRFCELVDLAKSNITNKNSHQRASIEGGIEPIASAAHLDAEWLYASVFSETVKRSLPLLSDKRLSREDFIARIGRNDFRSLILHPAFVELGSSIGIGKELACEILTANTDNAYMSYLEYIQ